MSTLGEHLSGGWKKQLGTKKEFESSRQKKEIARKMKIKEAVRHSGRTMHLGKKGAPGLYPNELTPKEKYYRKSNETRTNKRLEDFSKTGYGRHLSEKARIRGEEY